jgi:putative spermidine/putrescine transport system permease protein
MRSNKAPIGLTAATIGALVFLHFPLMVIVLYAFTTEEASFTFPPPGLTTHWFSALMERQDFWQALGLSVQVALFSTTIAVLLGTLIAAAIYRTDFFGKEAVSLLVVLPIALPGIVTGIALRSSMSLLGVPFSTWTIVIGHATFCIVNCLQQRNRALAPHVAYANGSVDGFRREYVRDFSLRRAAQYRYGAARGRFSRLRPII